MPPDYTAVTGETRSIVAFGATVHAPGSKLLALVAAREILGRRTACRSSILTDALSPQGLTLPPPPTPVNH